MVSILSVPIVGFLSVILSLCVCGTLFEATGMYNVLESADISVRGQLFECTYERKNLSNLVVKISTDVQEMLDFRRCIVAVSSGVLSCDCAEMQLVVVEIFRDSRLRHYF